MAHDVADTIRWLKTLGKNDQVYIDEGGLTLRSVDEPEAYYEIGGETRDDEEEVAITPLTTMTL